MTRLTTKARKAIPKKDFALPSKVHKGKRGGKITKGAYPIENISHARNALARVAANGSPAEKARVRRAVYAKYPSLKKSGKK